MVKICTDVYKTTSYDDYFTNFSFTLSDFQKYAIESIVTGNHILITAHTGSGKTLPAEFAITYFTKKKKKIIYTSPIKALSNQKYYDFTKKFPDISFGILTGDIKFNPEADVLIMTTEILRNTLLSKINKNENIPLQFDVDLENELACVVFDEIHYINDKDRGKIWEETIMLLPSHVQMVLLSATIDRPEVFAQWIEDTKKTENNNKTVYLAPTNHRVVPLKHYMFMALPEGNLKLIRDKEYRDQLKQLINKPIVVKEGKTKFNEIEYFKLKKFETYLKTNNVFIKKSFVLNQVVNYLKKNEMLPAICFVFSRKQVEILADSIGQTLFDADEVLPGAIQHECEKILKKLPNFNEYLNIPEYHFILRLLEKGIAIHHAGIMPVFREMIELLFSKGFVKLLFATETFAVGINMPTKTVVFTQFEKFNGENMRYLFPHEYTQMAGRAGRRGLDVLGHVIHLNNLFQFPDKTTYYNILNGAPQTLTSKYKVTYNLALNLNEVDEIENKKDFTSKSMIRLEIEKEIEVIESTIKNLYDTLEKKTLMPNYHEIVNNEKYENYLKLNENLSMLTNKKRKNTQREIDMIKQSEKNFEKNLDFYNQIITANRDLKKNEKDLDYMKNYFSTQTNNVVEFLTDTEFIVDNKLSLKGKYASVIQEAHCLVLSSLLESTDNFSDFTSIDLVCLFSCFTNIKVNDDYKIYNAENLTEKKALNKLLIDTENLLDFYKRKEDECYLDCGESYDYHYDLVTFVKEWCLCKDENSCKKVVFDLQDSKDVFLGEFVKAILKINNLVNEMVSICDRFGYSDLQKKLSEIPDLTLKFIATNQSLYV